MFSHYTVDFRPSLSRFVRCLLLCSALVQFSLPAFAAEKYVLEESASDSRTYSVTTKLDVDGQLEAAIGDGKAVGLKLNVDGNFKYLERRLSGIGREAEALRSARYYDEVSAKIVVNNQTSFGHLRDRLRLVAAQGRQDGVELYSPAGLMTRDEVDLLKIPGDSLAALALLPPGAVEVGDDWKPGHWVNQSLTGLEAVIKSELTCTLKSADDRQATVSFEGEIEGAISGAATTITLNGTYVFDLKEQHLKRLEMTQKEKASVSAVRPGLDVTAKVVMTRTPAAKEGELPESAVAGIPEAPSAGQLLLSFESPANVRFLYDRGWHVFHKDVAVLRYVDQGSLIAQCNVSPVPSTAPGRHTPKHQFQADIRAQLGDNLKKIGQTEELTGQGGNYLYRVVAIGEVNGTPMHWIYYLCAGPSGRQVSFAFVVETELIERLGDRDREIVKSLEFLTRKSPQEVQTGNRKD
jgi:hypothetical protein